jgi:nucleotide-binding universal stress UspA family protein
MKNFMKKIIAVINIHKPNLASIGFACRIAAMTGTKLTGLFVENIFFGYVPEDSYEPVAENQVKTTAKPPSATTTGHAIELFTEECHKNGLQPDVYVDKGEPIQEIIYESRFADLLVIDPGIDFYNRDEQLPSHLVKEVLANAECPVLLSPAVFRQIDEIVFCYDGSASSVFAIKQFTYLLPQLSSTNVLLLEVDGGRKKEDDDSYKRVLAWLQTHYRIATYESLHGDSKDELFGFLLRKENRFVVMGAYGRSLLSRFFRRSNADILIRSIDLPIFITHH